MLTLKTKYEIKDRKVNQKDNALLSFFIEEKLEIPPL